MRDHFLLYVSDREHGGFEVLGIFDSSDDAWKHYVETTDANYRYYNVPHVQHWREAERVIENSP